MDQKVTLIDKKSHQGIEVNASDKIQLSAQNPSVVQLKISSEDIKEYKKEGNNLVVVLKSGELITIMGFFDADNSLVLQDDVNHKLLWVEFSSNGEVLSATYAELNDVGPLLYGENDAASPWAWAAVPLTAGGILAWAGHDSGNDSDKAIGETNEGPSAPESVVIGNGDEWITADEIDADGKVDVTIELPTDAVAGDSVIVNGEETVLTADDIAAGEIIVKVDAPNEGETLEVDVIIKDKDGNESDPTQAEATVDTTAPSAPDSVIIGNGDEWISADEIDGDGKVDVKIDLPADAVAGDSVIVNGEETVLTADDIAAGEIIVKVDAPNEGETLEVEVSIKDAAGNESDEVLTEAAVDSVLPVVEIEAVTPIDSDDPADGVADQVLITGTSNEPNAPVIIKDKDGIEIGTGTTDANGDFAITLDTAAVQAGDDVTVEVTDKAGNTGTDTAAAGDLTFSTDTTDPIVEIEAVTPIDSDDPADGIADQVLITGTSNEPNAPVIIRDKDGIEIGTGTTDANGDFAITLDTAAVQAGDDVTVEVTDKAGNTGTDTATAGDLTFSTDSTEPVVEIEAVTPIDSDNPADGVADQVLITGTSNEPNAPVIIRDKDGIEIGTGTTDANGDFAITLDTAAVQAGDDVTVEVTDKAGNTGTDTAVAGDLIFTNDPLVLEDDSANAVYQESQVNPDPIGELTSDTAIKLLAGSSATDKLEFSIANGAQDVVITVKSESLVTVADAYSFTVINKETGQEYTVAASSTAQGGLVAGALGLEALGVIGDDGNGLRLDIHDLPPGDYEVVVQGDQSKLADILSTVSLEDLGSNTVETLILDTVTGLLKDALIGNENIAAGLLNQLSVEQLLNLVEGNPNPLVSGLGSTLQDVLENPLLALVLGDITSAAVGEILEGNINTGVLGLINNIPVFGPGLVQPLLNAVGGLVDGVVDQLDSIGEDLFNLVIEPLIADVLLAGLIDNLSLNDALNGLLGSIKDLLNTVGAGDLLPALDDVLQLVAQEILSNPAQLFNEVNAAVYGVDEKTYVAEGNVLANDEVVNGSIIEVNGVPITFNQTDVNGNYAIITGTHGTLHLYEDGHYIYTSTVTSGNATSVVDDFTYTVQDEYNNTEDAVFNHHNRSSK